MQVEQLTAASGWVIEGPLLITPQMFGDERGFFFGTRSGDGTAHSELEPCWTLDGCLIPACISGRDRL